MKCSQKYKHPSIMMLITFILSDKFRATILIHHEEFCLLQACNNTVFISITIHSVIHLFKSSTVWNQRPYTVYILQFKTGEPRCILTRYFRQRKSLLEGLLPPPVGLIMAREVMSSRKGQAQK